jgi:hypothetical protein
MGLECGTLSLMSTIGSYLEEKVAALVQKTEITAVGIRRADYTTPFYPQKLALTSPKSGGRSDFRVRLRIKATKLLLFLSYIPFLIYYDPYHHSSRRMHSKSGRTIRLSLIVTEVIFVIYR